MPNIDWIGKLLTGQKTKRLLLVIIINNEHDRRNEKLKTE